MPSKIRTITLSLPFRLGSVNCYLIETETGYVLIDTGSSRMRKDLEKKLKNIGCLPSNLKLILLTHGDFDHSGNAAYLRKKYGATIAMHYDDSGMVERGDIFWNRNKGNILFKKAAAVLFGFGKSERFKPDLYLEGESDLSVYGFDATVFHIPGHTKGSIGIITAAGDLFCGDLLVNGNKPSLNSLIDDMKVATGSINKLRALAINTVYPGHGKPFSMDEFRKYRR